EDRVFLARARSAHLPVLALLLDRGDKRFQIVDLGVGRHPQEERIERHARDRRELGYVDAQVLVDDRGGVEAVQRHQDGVIVTRLVLQVAQRFGARTARLVDRDERPWRKVLFLDQALHQSGYLIGPAAGSGHDDELDRLLRLPLGRRLVRYCSTSKPETSRCRQSENEALRSLHASSSNFWCYKRAR